jgi:hypothetical protein
MDWPFEDLNFSGCHEAQAGLNVQHRIDLQDNDGDHPFS